MTRLEKGYVLVDELADERPVGKAVGAISLKTGEPAGIRTQDPRLKRAMLYRLSYRLTDWVLKNAPSFVQTGILPLTNDD